jgi:hypothetical protein
MGTALKKQRDWTPEQRLEQSCKLRERKIWLKSTGPRTPEGKQASSRNARKASYEQRQEMKQIMHYLRTQKSYLDLLKYFIKQQDRMTSNQRSRVSLHLFIFENELRDIEALLRSESAVGGKIIPFPSPPPPKKSINLA